MADIPRYVKGIDALADYLFAQGVIDREWQDELTAAGEAAETMERLSNDWPNPKGKGAHERYADALMSLERLATILTEFGALDPDDDVTDPLDLLEALLPPDGAA